MASNKQALRHARPTKPPVGGEGRKNAGKEKTTSNDDISWEKIYLEILKPLTQQASICAMSFWMDKYLFYILEDKGNLLL